MKQNRFLLRLGFFMLCLSLACTALMASQLPYHGNIQSKIFHSQYCRFYECRNCTARFETRLAALAAGFRPCKICNP